jgi:hypothetical protein
MTTPHAPTCSTCRFYDPLFSGGDDGLCRRYPPRVIGDDGDATGIFPEVMRNAWCGEYAKGRRQNEDDMEVDAAT